MYKGNRSPQVNDLERANRQLAFKAAKEGIVLLRNEENCLPLTEKRIALDKLEDYVGSYLALHLSHPYKGENDLQGTLVNLTPETISLEIAVKARKQVIQLNRADVEKARLAIKF